MTEIEEVECPECGAGGPTNEFVTTVIEIEEMNQDFTRYRCLNCDHIWVETDDEEALKELENQANTIKKNIHLMKESWSDFINGVVMLAIYVLVIVILIIYFGVI